jgi:hypothetical protein
MTQTSEWPRKIKMAASVDLVMDILMSKAEMLLARMVNLKYILQMTRHMEGQSACKITEKVFYLSPTQTVPPSL